MRSNLIKPRALRRGDTVAVIRPSSRLEHKDFQRTLRTLRKLGFCAVSYEEKFPKDSFFASSDEARAKELHWAFSEPGIKCVLAARGGYGAVRTLRLITPKQRATWRPKIFVGYSDSTYILHYLLNQKKWMGIHGPLVGWLNEMQTKRLMNSLLETPSQISGLKIWQSGSAKGQLLGGNLSLLQVRGPARLPEVPMILALEDIHEHHYRLDRMIWNLIDAGYDRYVKGIVLGHFESCGEKDSKKFPWARVMGSLEQLTRGPILSGASFGHGLKFQSLLPIGMKARIKGRTLFFEEAWTCE